MDFSPVQLARYSDSKLKLSGGEAGECSTSISNFVAPDFLAKFHGPSFSYTIWDHLAEEVDSRDGAFPASSVDNLLSAFKDYLAETVMFQIRHTLEALEDSNLGVDTILVRSKSSIFEGILLDLKQRAYGPENKSNDNSGNRERLRSDGRREGNASEGRSKGQNSRSTSRGASYAEDGEEDGEDDEKDSETRTDEERARGDRFLSLERIPVDLEWYSTPPKGSHQQNDYRKMSIAQRAQLFANHSVMADVERFSRMIEREGTVSFFHGTRSSSLHGFSDVGIVPMKNYTEFSVMPAFYVTNRIVPAFEFPLHNRLARDPGDTVAVIHFDLASGILHGKEVSPAGRIFRVKRFKQGLNDREWEEFCCYNLYGKRRRQHRYDIVIGPMCMPNFATRSLVPRNIPDMVQVAFCTEEAWEWAESSVKRVFVEKRNQYRRNQYYG